MKRLLHFISRLFRRKSDWDGLPYGKPAAVEDEAARLNGER